MNQRTDRFFSSGLLAAGYLAGMTGMFGSVQGLCGGEPIRFSSPKQDVENPGRKPFTVDPPRQPLRWDRPNPEATAPIPPPMIVIDPRTEKILRERREENKDWLLNGPSLFREKSPGADSPGRILVDDPFKGWDANVERVLGKERNDSAVGNQSKSPNSPLYSGDPLFDRWGKATPKAESSDFGALESSGKDPLRNKNESAMKALFETRSSAEKMPVLPGMSLYEMMGAVTVNAKALKHDREMRQTEFNQILSPQDKPKPAAGGWLESVGVSADQTRTLINPVIPTPTENILPSKSPLEMGMPPNVGDKFTHPKLPFDEVVTRMQGHTPVTAVDIKTRQMETLRLMTRPSVLTLPGRSF